MDSCEIVKIAVEYTNPKSLDKNQEFFEFDRSLDLSVTIENMCGMMNVPNHQTYALKFSGFSDNDEKYVTEDNKFEVKNGNMLKLKTSAAMEVRTLCNVLKQGSLVEKNQLLMTLSNNCGDPEFVKAFLMNENALDITMNFICNGKTSEKNLKLALKSFAQICEHESFNWDWVTESFLNHLFVLLHKPETHADVITPLLSILECATLNSDKFLKKIQESVNLIYLFETLERYREITTQKNILALMNALFSKHDQKHQLLFSKIFVKTPYREKVYDIYSRTPSEFEAEIERQLAEYQSNTLYHLQNRSTTILRNENDTNALLIRLIKCAFSEDNPCYISKLMFTDVDNPIEDFSAYPGMLLTDCLNHLINVEWHHKQFKTMMTENFYRVEKSWFPFGRASIELIKALLKILQIEESSRACKKFHPMLLTTNNPFEEMFCICLFAFYKTWKDMKAKTMEDFDRIVNNVSDQIIHSIKTPFTNLQNFAKNLNDIDVVALRELRRQSQRNLKGKSESLNFLRDNIVTPEMVELLKKQRIKFLKEGSMLEIFIKGVRSQHKMWFTVLSNDNKEIWYKNGPESPNKDDMKKISVQDITQLLIESDCPHYRDIRGGFPFSIGYDSKLINGQECLNFVAPDENTFNYWTDGEWG